MRLGMKLFLLDNRATYAIMSVTNRKIFLEHAKNKRNTRMKMFIVAMNDCSLFFSNETNFDNSVSEYRAWVFFSEKIAIQFMNELNKKYSGECFVVGTVEIPENNS